MPGMGGRKLPDTGRGKVEIWLPRQAKGRGRVSIGQGLDKALNERCGEAGECHDLAMHPMGAGVGYGGWPGGLFVTTIMARCDIRGGMELWRL